MNHRTMAVLAVAVTIMMAVTAIPLIGSESDAAVGDGGSYSYTIEYNQSLMSSGSAAISVAGMTPISHPSYDGTDTSGYGSWTWDATTGIGPFNSFYGAFDSQNSNAFVGVLNPYNLNELLDGTDISGEASWGYNIMWVLPTVYWSATEGTGGANPTLTLSNDPSSGVAYAHTINGHVYNYLAIGVYEGASDGEWLLSICNPYEMYPSQDERQNIREQATAYSMSSALNVDSNYPAHSMLWNFYQWELYKYCCYTLMEDFNSQNTVGNGIVYTDEYTIYTGITVASGPYTGNPGAITNMTNAESNGGSYVKLFIENAWGGNPEYIDGIVADGTSGLWIDTSSSPTDATSAGTYVTYIQQAAPTAGFMNGISTNAQTWGLGTSAGGSATVGLSDRYDTSATSNRVAVVGGGHTDTYGSNDDLTKNGVSYLNFGNGLSDSVAVGRLAFVFDADLTSSTPVTSITPDQSTITIQTPTEVSATISPSNATTPDLVPTVTSGSNIITLGSVSTIGDTSSVTVTPIGVGTAVITWSATDGSGVTATQTVNVTGLIVTLTATPSGYGRASESALAVPYGTIVSASGRNLTVNGATAVTAIPSQSDAQYTYSFTGWTGIPVGGTITENTTITANFAREINSYTISITADPSDYGTVSQSSLTVPYGTTISSSKNTLTIGETSITATPTTNTAQYAYAFSNWTGIPSGGTITGDTTITANFTQTVRNYEVRLNISMSNREYGHLVVNGSNVFATGFTVPYGTSISESGNVLTVGNNTATAVPTTSTDQYTYAFTGWSGIPSSGIVTGNTSIGVSFSRTVVQTSTVTISASPGGYGNVSESTIQNVPYDTTIRPSGNTLIIGDTTITATPTTNTDQYHYSFTGWSGIPSSGRVTEDISITANFSRLEMTYSVFVHTDSSGYGNVSQGLLTNVPYGTSISASGNVLTVGSTEVTATPNQSGAQYTYSFTGWTGIPVGGTVTEDVTITANFAQETNTYTISITADPSDYGTVTQSSLTVPYGASISKNSNKLTVNGTVITAAPIASTAQYAYSFTDWIGAPNSGTVTGNMSITASFTRAERSYTVDFVASPADYGIVSMSWLTLPYGTTIDISGPTISLNSSTVTATPIPDTDQYDYAFTGWSSSIAPVGGIVTVTGPVTITAEFTRTTQNYTVTINAYPVGWGTVSQSSLTVPYGTTISSSGNVLTVGGTDVTATPTPATDHGEYRFTGWAPSSGTVTRDMTVTAGFSEYLYAVTISADPAGYGMVSQSSIDVPYGTTISSSGNVLTVGETQITATPTAPTDQYAYSFTDWAGIPAGGTVTRGMAITANFSQEERTYTVTLTVDPSGYGTVSQSSLDVPYGASISTSGNILTIGGTTVTATPTAATAQYTYSFTDWAGIPSGDTVTGDMTITASFSQSVRSYDITWVIDGERTVEQYEYGETPVPPEVPEKEGYTFEGWRPAITEVTGDATYTAHYDGEIGQSAKDIIKLVPVLVAIGIVMSLAYTFFRSKGGN